MKRAQFLGWIAGVCGVAAFFGVMSLVNKPAKVVKEEVTTNTTQVLVAKTEVPLGAITGPEKLPLAGLAAKRARCRLYSAHGPPERDQGPLRLGGARADAAGRTRDSHETCQGR